MGFVEKYSSEEVQIHGHETSDEKHVSSLGRFFDFLKSLSNNEYSFFSFLFFPIFIFSNALSVDGRVVVQREQAAHFRYLMLNPLVNFQSIIDEAHSVVLCGGTMQVRFTDLSALGSIVPFISPAI